jgi:hypothetical protein
MSLGKPESQPVDYRIPNSLPVLGDDGHTAFAEAVEEHEREAAEARRINTQIYATGVVPEGVEIGLYASSHPAFGPDAWRAYQERHGVVQGAVPADRVDVEAGIAQLEAVAEERRKRSQS